MTSRQKENYLENWLLVQNASLWLDGITRSIDTLCATRDPSPAMEKRTSLTYCTFKEHAVYNKAYGSMFVSSIHPRIS